MVVTFLSELAHLVLVKYLRKKVTKERFSANQEVFSMVQRDENTCIFPVIVQAIFMKVWYIYH